MPVNRKSWIQTRLILYSVSLLAIIISLWLNIINNYIAFTLFFIFSILHYLEMCKKCKNPYLLQKWKNPINIGAHCNICGAPIE